MFRRPSAALTCRYLRMAFLAKAYKVTVIVGAALRQRLDMVHLLGRGDSSFLLTHLTQRVLRYMAVADAFPRSAVPAAHSRVPVVLLVAFVLLLLMFFTEPAVHKPRAAGVGAWALWFSWHVC